jgi:nucleotide-binding universal stress UspA family protein
MYEKILVGTDGSPTAAKAVDRAVQFAKSAGASLTILSAGRPERAQKAVDTEAARHASAGVAIDTRVAEGDAVEELVKAASSGDYDLLVTGNRGMTGVTRFLRLGSVPNKITHQLPCSLLIVKTT